jgi:hypothetical protein
MNFLEKKELKKIINFENDSNGLLEIFPIKKEFTITFLLGKYLCTLKPHNYEIDEKNIFVNFVESSILTYTAVDSFGYNYENIHIFKEKLENDKDKLVKELSIFKKKYPNCFTNLDSINSLLLKL